MATGTGGSLGAALNALLRDFGVEPMRRLSTYHAKHWHAQLSQLTNTQRGWEALERAGLTVRPETLIKWLSDPEYNVRRSYRETIHAAYESVAVVPADPIPQAFKNAQFEIRGRVVTGDDDRLRGVLNEHGRVTAPLRIDGRSGNWVEIERKWADGELTDDAFEDDFIDYVIIEDIGEGTDGWEFPGSSYTVTA
ncbi:hypothetical protein PV332_14410 [Streptomyces scabiei]|uniref:hypothetical protein n=1 Tax=Streptomyces TaxID=1883 RepID=UPI00073A8D4C|nr:MULTISPECIES: hypothetical protein [Streptomyces]ALV39369.1 hypothetical protein AS200_45645 [Streptomyces sp. CdTB01]MBK3645701.1 hypothetical protein [Streptomyces sp. MBT33]MDX2576662.1 hypothetical protein [Streptomyces scabiei]MDX3027656.1 hypothetical protein [Streptomyces scabiei]MDX3206323.1 hypothetical protein [Streptomyces scabiei]